MAFRVVVLASGSGTLLQALIDADDPSYELVAVGSDVPDATALERAGRAGVPTFVIEIDRPYPLGSAERLAFDRALTSAVAEFEPDLVVLAGFMKLLDAPFLEAFGGRIINSHPSLLPNFPGAHAVRDALAAGAQHTGTSLFWVDAGVDTGELIAQERVDIDAGDDEDTLHERIKVVERALLVRTVAALAAEGNLMSERTPIKRALVSVYDKARIDELAQALTAAGVEIVSTGSTAQALAAAGAQVTPVEQVTGFPECLDGRVKTLHPKVHAGILADRRLETHRDQLVELGVDAFDLVVSNLYPFSETVASGADFDECIEKIDIGGPSMVRGAAKNHANVAIVTSPAQYDRLFEALQASGTTLDERRALAAEAFAHTAAYDVAVASWFTADEPFAPFVGMTFEKVGDLRYGENSHQKAAVYAAPNGGGLVGAQQLGGKEMSYNNYVDADAARRAAYDFDEPAVAVIKHANPCGIAVGADIAEAHRKAHQCDPVSAFGGVIAANRPVSVEMARFVSEIFTEVIVAPGYDDGAVEILTAKKNLRVLVAEPSAAETVNCRQVSGGMLVQDADLVDADGDDVANWQLVAGEAADEATLADLAFAWRAVRSAKSNAILLAKDGASVGVGMGQVNRVDSCKLAVERAGERAAGSVAASDAFFPFADGPQILIDAGVRAIVQPGGSMRDADTIEAARAAGVTMYFTSTRHFFH